MSRRSLVSVNVPSLTADPTAQTPNAGDVYYNSSTGKLRVYTGSAWVDAGGGGGTPHTHTVTVSFASYSELAAGKTFTSSSSS